MWIAFRPYCLQLAIIFESNDGEWGQIKRSKYTKTNWRFVEISKHKMVCAYVYVISSVVFFIFWLYTNSTLNATKNVSIYLCTILDVVEHDFKPLFIRTIPICVCLFLYVIHWNGCSITLVETLHYVSRYTCTLLFLSCNIKQPAIKKHNHLIIARREWERRRASKRKI